MGGDAGAWDELAGEWIAAEMEENPTAATGLGIGAAGTGTGIGPGIAPEGTAGGGMGALDERIGDFSEVGFARRQAADRSFLGRCRSFTDASPDLDEPRQIDAALLASHLEGRGVMAGWQLWRRDPAVYLGPCLYGIFWLFLNRLHPEHELARRAGSRLLEVPGVMTSARANLSAELAHPVIVGRGAGQARAGAAYLASMPGELGDDRLRAGLGDAALAASEALAGFASYLDDLAGRATGEYAIGEERYSALLERSQLLGYGAPRMREKGRQAYASINEDMARLAARLPDGEQGWLAALARLDRAHPASPEEMRASYESWTERARQHLVDNEIVTLPDGESCSVEASPPFQRPVLAVASYSPPPAFSASMAGHFFVPYPPDGTPAAEVAKRLEANSYSSIPTTAVHEAYPGHHWHLSWSKLSTSPLRKVVRTPYFSEGWALYAERLMREHGFFDEPASEIGHLAARIFRAARIVVDTSLHIGDMSFDEAVSFMQRKAGLPEPTARAEVGRYCSWPTQASSYLTGALEIERIRDRYLALGLGTTRQFNDRIAASGSLPIALAERAVLGGPG
ncbi:MAG: DUF885 domain-containing protein [Acidimicrobiales bacterium]